ncbi:MAG: hypothetical protein J6O04_11120 [Selenomonadaceae bacterium]|nr:hypothetical protein [Selenomonadaceae bacterium]
MVQNIEMNKLNDSQLENVAGGCSYESFELFHALRGNNAFQKDYPGLFAPPVNQEVKIDDNIMEKALLEKMGIKAQINWGPDEWFDCNKYVSADTGKRLYHDDVIKAIKNYKG